MTSLTIRLHGEIYEAFRYPGGETQVRIKPEHVHLVEKIEEIKIIARIHGAEDLIEILLLIDAIHGVTKDCKVILPYLPYARADRRFAVGDCFGLGFLSTLFRHVEVITLDAHSHVAEREFDAFVNVDPTPIIEQAIVDFAKFNNANSICVLYPDEGASNRYFLPLTIGAYPESISVKHLIAYKKRDPLTGKFFGFNVPGVEEFANAPTLIIDDIIDAGGTFVGIGALIQDSIKLGLYVTHGIFSKGIEVLRPRFSWVACTNSFCEYVQPSGKKVDWLDRVYEIEPMLLSNREVASCNTPE